jgi:hypothetical protein
LNQLAQPAVLAEVETRMRSLRPDSVRRWGRMSAHQMICHLNDSYLVGLGERAAASKVGRTAGLQRVVALYILPRWPHGVPTMAEADQEGGGTKPVEFENDREALVRLTKRFSMASEFAPHPIFGSMSAGDWMRWGYMHADHHLRQFAC